MGLALEITFKPPAIAVNQSLLDDNLRVIVRYELYQGMPIMSKQIKITTLDASKTSDTHITYVEVERLGTNVPFSPSSSESFVYICNSFVFLNCCAFVAFSFFSCCCCYCFVVSQKKEKYKKQKKHLTNKMTGYFDYWTTSPNAMLAYSGLLWIEVDTPHVPVVSWYQDPNENLYKSINYGGYEPMVSCYYGLEGEQTSMDIRLAPELPGTFNGTFESFRVFEIFLDEIGNMERTGMARQRLMSYLTPATLENPIYTQTTNLSNVSLHRIIDQCKELGFELLAFSFGCGFNIETTNQTQLEYYESVIGYATNSAGWIERIFIDFKIFFPKIS